MSWFHDHLVDLPGPDDRASAGCTDRAGRVLRPAGALARLDSVAGHIAAWRCTAQPRVSSPAVTVFAGDHGVTAAGVSAYPAEVTASMLDAVRAGRATINSLAREVGAELRVVDVGVSEPTGDIRFVDAMTTERLDSVAALAGSVVDGLASAGTDLLVVGELGIGNTTAAACVPTVLLGGGAHRWVGRGTGVDDTGLGRKIAAVELAVDRTGPVDDPLTVFEQVTGTEMVAMAAAVLRARHHRIPVVLDGYVATAAVLPLRLARSDALDHCLAGHRSAEPGHRHLLDALGLEPLLDLSMRLGEGSGALAAVPLIRAACACVTDVATFEEWFGS